MTSLVLASTSRYRAELLTRLGLAFTTVDPAVDETPVAGETPRALAERLARAKALAGVSLVEPGSLVIGSDQVYELNGEALGKPGQIERARAQLTASSGREAVFHTAVCLARGADARTNTIPTRVRFRDLSRDAIERYLEREPALDCAGSFRSERLGITLFEWVRSDDPTAIVGLPLIALRQMLAEFGVSLP